MFLKTTSKLNLPPPDLTAILDSFDSPTRALTQDDVDELVAYAEETIEQLKGLEIEDQLLDAVYNALEKEKEGSDGAGGAMDRAPVEARVGKTPSVRSKSQALTLEGDGFLRVHRVCEGWDEPVVDEDKNGALSAIVGFTDAGIDPVIWGNFRACRYPTNLGDVLLEDGGEPQDAGIALHWGGPIKAEDVGTQPILFVLNLDATVAGSTTKLRVSFRVDRTLDRYELLLETDEGSLVLIVEGRTLVGVRARDGEYTCDATLVQCSP